MENEENGNELEEKDNAAGNEMTETDEPKTETETETGSDQEVDAEKLLEQQPQVQTQQYTSDLYETENFTLEVSHQITAGDMLVSVLLAILIGVTLLGRLISRP